MSECHNVECRAVGCPHECCCQSLVPHTWNCEWAAQIDLPRLPRPPRQAHIKRGRHEAIR